jgi:hypothetical protein
MPTISEIAAYIRQAAMRRGIDPDIAVRVAKSEGLAPGVWQSNVYRNGVREPSYGPFQLLVRDGGLGSAFQRATGRSVADPSTAFDQVDFALDQAARGGWGPWYGAAKVGIGRRDGLTNARPAGIGSGLAASALDFARNNPQPGGYGPGIDGPSRSASGGAQAPMFGSMSPGAGQPPRRPPAAAILGTPSRHASGEEGGRPSLGERLKAAGQAFDEAMHEYSAPSIRPVAGFSGDTGNGLINLLKNPNALALALLARRMG